MDISTGPSHTQFSRYFILQTACCIDLTILEDDPEGSHVLGIISYPFAYYTGCLC
jgi:hypothetical protein